MKKKKQDPNQSAEKSPSDCREYNHNGDVWVVEAYAKLLALFPGAQPEYLPALHELGDSRKDLKTSWLMTQRLCGIHPVILPMNVDVKRLGPVGRESVATVFRLKDVSELDAQISLFQLAWQRLLTEEDAKISFASVPPEVPLGPPQAAKASPVQSIQATQADQVDFTPEQIELLNLGSFPTAIFGYTAYGHDRQVEVTWFCDRIKELRKVFEEPIAKDPAQLALLNQLQLRRINHKLVTMDPQDKAFIALQQTKGQVEETYRKQWEQVVEICPFAARSSDRKTAVQSLSDTVALYQKFKADPANQLRDGVFTDDEIQVLFRQSVQDPTVKYRMGWVLACNEARLGLDNPKFKRQMSLAQCKMLDTGFAFAANKLAEKMNLPKPDLESDGPDGEYPPIHMAADGDVTEPEFDKLVEAEEEVDPVEISEPGSP